MTSINGQVGGFRKEVGYPKLRPAPLIASSLVLVLEDVLGEELRLAGRVVQDAIDGWIRRVKLVD
jgi:hypothetical protein